MTQSIERPIRVLVVDDSPAIRQKIVDILVADGRFEVVGEAENGSQALRMITELEPDVVSLDIIMPGMNGITALKYLMIHHPTPTVMISSLTQEGAEASMESLRFGAVDFVPKPSALEPGSLDEQAAEMTEKLAWAARVEIDALRYIRARPSPEHPGVGTEPCGAVVAMGAHEGGYAALMKILPQIDPDVPVAWIIILYEHSRYVDSFIEYMNHFCGVELRRAVDGAPLNGGLCYVAAGEDYVTLHPTPEQFQLHVHPAPFDSQKGSINRIFYSIADVLGERCGGVVLSGSGDDGFEGLEEIMRVGGNAILQEPGSCLVKEMVELALRQGSAAEVIPDSAIAKRLNQIFRNGLE